MFGLMRGQTGSGPLETLRILHILHREKVLATTFDIFQRLRQIFHPTQPLPRSTSTLLNPYPAPPALAPKYQYLRTI